MMACVLVPLVLAVLLCSPGTEQASPCPPQWLLFGQSCFAFYPVWSSWSAANSLCSQTGGNLASFHTPEERQFVHQLASTHTPVWLGGYQTQQNGSWFWSDDSSLSDSDWTNQRQAETGGGGACMQIDPKSGELHGAPCGELRFYICSTRARLAGSWSSRYLCEVSAVDLHLRTSVQHLMLAELSSEVSSKNTKPVDSGVVPTVSLVDVVWGYSDSLAEEILRSSSFLKELWSGHLTQRCYSRFMQQEALYLHRVSGTLEALTSHLQEADELRSLLLDTLERYSSRNQSLLDSPPPQWLVFSLQSFHSVVLEEPVYWLVALSARACLRDFLAGQQVLSESRTGTLVVSGSEVRDGGLYQDWRGEALKEVAWTQRYRKVIEQHQDHMDAFKAINIFREHMMNQKSFYKAVDCDVGEDERRRGGEKVGPL